MDTIVAIVNAQGVLNEVVESNIEILTEEGFLVADKQKVQLTQDQVAKLNVPDAEAALFYMGPVVMLLLKREQGFDAMNHIFPQLDDIYYTHTPFLALRDQQLLFPQLPYALERAVCVVKPGYTQEQLTAVMDALVENNFVVLGKAARVLAPDVAQQLVAPVPATAAEAAAEAEAADPDAPAAPVGASLSPAAAAEADQLSADVSVSLVVEKLNAVAELALLLGPQDPEEARVHAPYTLRARFGVSALQNVCFQSASAAQARAQVPLLFPSPFPLERTVALVKPDAFAHAHAVLDAVAAHGFTVQAEDTVHLSKTRCEVLYAHLKGQPHYADVVAFMASGPCKAILLSKPAAIASLRALCGPSDPVTAKKFAPQSLRARFGTTALCNAIDASQDGAAAAADVAAFFPALAAERIPTADEVETLMSKRAGAFRAGGDVPKSLKDVLGEGLSLLCKVRPKGDDALVWLAKWLLRNNPNRPVMLAPEMPAGDDDDSDAEEPSIETRVVSGAGGVINNSQRNAHAGALGAGRAGAVASTGAGARASVLQSIPTASAASRDVVVSLRPQKDHTAAIVVATPTDSSTSSASTSTNTSTSAVTFDPWASAPLVTVQTAAKKPRVVWAVGGPGSGQELLVPAVGSLLGLDVVHVPALLDAAVAQQTECGRVLAKHRKLGRPAPSHIVVTLIQQAIAQCQPAKGSAAAAAGAGARGVILSQFPLSLDDAFAFEQAFDAPAALLHVHCAEDAALTRLFQAQTTPVPKQELLARAKSFAEAAQPVVEHYTGFNKVVGIATDDTLVTPADFAKQHAAPLVAQALSAQAPKERAPRKPRKMPVKKVVAPAEEAY